MRVDSQRTARHMHVSFVVVLCLLVAGLYGCTTIAPLKEGAAPMPPSGSFSHALLDEAARQYVDDNGLVDYRALKQNPQLLEQYYAMVAAYSPDSHGHLFPSRQHQLAYWINAYNAAAMTTVLRYYPINSVLDVKQPGLFFFLTDKSGFFFFQRLSFGGKMTSLYYLENAVIRKRYNDPRIHFVLNCASLGCPRLPREAFTGDRLERQLDRETRRFLSESRNFAIDHDNQTIRLSEIFKWYRKDFIRWYAQQYPNREADLLGYIALYLPTDQAADLSRIRKSYRVQFTAYDWGLNDQAPAPSDR